MVNRLVPARFLRASMVTILVPIVEVTADDSLSVSLNQPERSSTDEGRRDDAQALSAGVDRFRARQRSILSGANAMNCTPLQLRL